MARRRGERSHDFEPTFEVMVRSPGGVPARLAAAPLRGGKDQPSAHRPDTAGRRMVPLRHVRKRNLPRWLTLPHRVERAKRRSRCNARSANAILVCNDLSANAVSRCNVLSANAIPRRNGTLRISRRPSQTVSSGLPSRRATTGLEFLESDRTELGHLKSNLLRIEGPADLAADGCDDLLEENIE